MKSWFGTRATTAPSDDGVDHLAAYKEGRLDERRRVEHDVGRSPVDKSEVDAAYQRGFRQGRARRGGSALVGFLIFIIVVIGGALIYLAVTNGSFASGGAVADRDIGKVTGAVRAPIQNAADKTGNALQNAGQKVKQEAGSGNAPPS